MIGFLVGSLETFGLLRGETAQRNVDRRSFMTRTKRQRSVEALNQSELRAVEPAARHVRFTKGFSELKQKDPGRLTKALPTPSGNPRNIYENSLTGETRRYSGDRLPIYSEEELDRIGRLVEKALV